MRYFLFEKQTFNGLLKLLVCVQMNLQWNDILGNLVGWHP